MLPTANFKTDFQEEWLEFHGIMTFSTYRRVLKSQYRLRQLLRDDRFLDEPEAIRFLKLPENDLRYTPDLKGWLSYIVDIEPEFGGRLLNASRHGTFPALPRRNHTVIAAPNGWGKSELLKALAFHDIQHPGASLVVVEPRGDMVGQLARFPEVVAGDRLVLLQPELAPGMYPCLNPLQVHGLDAVGKARYASTLAGALSLIAGNDLSGHMATVARACIRVLLDRPGSTLSDLAAMLTEPQKSSHIVSSTAQSIRREKLVQLGRNYYDGDLADFFCSSFDSGSFKSSKSGLLARLNGLLMMPDFRAMTCGPSTVDLESHIEARKVILVNLSLLDNSARFAFGRLLLALIEDIGQRRVRLGREDRVPVQCIIDEATMVVSPTMVSIINELRKYGIYLTLAQQIIGQEFGADGRRVLNSVGCKFAGGESRRELVSMFEGEADKLDALKHGEFWVKWGRTAPVRLQVRSDLKDDTYSVPEGVWDKVKTAQLRAFYRPLADATASAPIATPKPILRTALQPWQALREG